MKILMIARQELIRNLRDIKMIAILTIFPILTIFIVGNIQSDSASVTVSVGYVNEDQQSIGEAFDSFVDSDEVKENFDIVTCKSLKAAKDKVKTGDIDCYIYLPEKLSEQVMNGKEENIVIDGNKNVDLVDSVVNSFVTTLKTTTTVVALGETIETPNTDNVDIQRISTKEGKGKPDSIDYYSIVMLLEMLIIGSVFGVFISNQPEDSDINIRLYSLPVGRVKLMAGRTLGSIGSLFLSAMVTFLFSKFVYNANWDGNIFIILSVILIFSAIIIGMGIIIGMFVSSYTTAFIFVLLLMIIFGIVSGAISPGTSISGLNNFIPNYHAQNLLFGTIYGYPKEIVYQSWIGLIAFFAGIYAIVIMMIRREN